MGKPTFLNAKTDFVLTRRFLMAVRPDHDTRDLRVFFAEHRTRTRLNIPAVWW